MKTAPELPTFNTEINRQRISAGLETAGLPLVDIQGPCAPEIKSAHIILNEGRRLSVIGRTLTGLVTVHGLPMSKPRSNPESWKGEHSTNPELALAMIELSASHVPVAMEIVEEDEIDIYVPHLSLAWTGARNEENFDLKLRIVSEHQTLPLPIKNGLDGNIDFTLEEIERLRVERDAASAPIVLCYRGGENARTPDEWAEQYVNAIKLTSGLMVVDVAHGSEMAHQPAQKFEKSQLGQIACLDHVIELAKDGLVPAGVKIEACDAPSPIDPVIPFDVGFNKTRRLQDAILKPQ